MAGIRFVNKGKELTCDRTFLASPTMLAPSQFKAGTGITDPTVSDTDLETPVIITGASYVKDIEVGYPIIDYTNHEVLIQTKLTTIDANGNLISETAVFNKDGTPVMVNRVVFVGMSKTSGDEFIYEHIFQHI